MEFEINESFEKYTFWDKAKEALQGYLTILYLPFAYAKHLVDKVRGIKELRKRKLGVWSDYINYDTYKVDSLALSDEESTKILESEILDFPDWKDWGDPFRSILRLKAIPQIKELKDSFFDEIDLKTKVGTFLIRINKKGKGMTLCILTSEKPELIEVIKLKPLSWILEESDKGIIQLSGFADKGVHQIEVKLPSSVIN